MKDKICKFCALTDTCENYKGIITQNNLEITECANMVRLVTYRSCFDCIHASIFESEHEWLSCRCAKTGEVTKQNIFHNDCKDFECIRGCVFNEDNQKR